MGEPPIESLISGPPLGPDSAVPLVGPAAKLGRTAAALHLLQGSHGHLNFAIIDG